MTDLRKAAEMALEVMEYNRANGTPNMGAAIDALRQALAQPEQKREWVGLSALDKTFLRTAYAQLRPLYHDKKEDVSVAAEVVTDWDAFFAAIDAKLKEKNSG